MNRCATFAYRLIVPQSRHNNLEIVLSRKRRKRGKRGARGRGNKNRKRTSKSKNKKIKIEKKKIEKVKITHVKKKRWRISRGAGYIECRRNYSLKRLPIGWKKRGPQTVTFVIGMAGHRTTRTTTIPSQNSPSSFPRVCAARQKRHNPLLHGRKARGGKLLSLSLSLAVSSRLFLCLDENPST